MNNYQKAAQKRAADPVWKYNQEDAALKRARPVLCVTTGIVYASKGKAASVLGVRPSNIHKCLLGQINHTGGYQFTWADS